MEKHTITIDDELPNRIRNARDRVGISQKELASRMRDQGFDGWRQNTVVRVESRQRRLSVGEVFGLSRVIGIDLLDGEVELSPVGLGSAVAAQIRGLSMKITDLASEA